MLETVRYGSTSSPRTVLYVFLLPIIGLCYVKIIKQQWLVSSLSFGEWLLGRSS